MKGYVTDASGMCWQLPPCERWEMEYCVGTPCDSFLLRCPWSLGQGVSPRQWVRFHAQWGGERVFTGVVDECEVTLNSRGCFLELSGRGLAALLLDNEALGQDYQLASPADILRDHVTPYGIEAVGAEGLSPVSNFRVDTGSSEWTVLEEFLREQGLSAPKFDREGRLILSGGEETALVLDDSTPVSALVHRDRRYGVLSEVLVRERYGGGTRLVTNGEFSALGGRARRVLTVAGRALPHEMERAGLEQLERSAREWEEIEVTLPAPFAARPGQQVTLRRRGYDHNGDYRVARVTTGMNTEGYWSRLLLRRRESV